METLSLGGTEYVVVPKAEYLRLLGREDDDGVVDAGEFMRTKIARNLKAAREHAGLTQAQLAEKLGKAQTTVSQSERGKIRVSEAYVRQVLKACRLPANWTAPKRA